MAKEGYVVYVVTGRERGNPDADLRPLDDLDGKGTSLVDAVHAKERPLWSEAAPQKRARHEHAFTFKRPGHAWGAPGCLLISGEAGPYGRRGRLVEVDTGSDKPFGVKEAALIPLRAGLMTFPGERFGLLFCERRSGATIKYDYEASVLKPAAKDAGVVIGLESHVDIETWENFLDEAQIASVSAVYYSTRREDFLPGMAKGGRLSLAVEGAPANRAGRNLVRQMLDAVRRGAQRGDAVLIRELQPRDGDDFLRDRVELEAVQDGLRRKVVFEESGFPQWVYELDHQPSNAELVNIWNDHGPRLIRRYLSDPPR